MGWQITFDGTKRDISPEARVTELAVHPYRSIWEGGKVVDLDDLSPDTYEQIALAEKDSDVNWWTVYRFPGGQAARLHKVMSAAAEFAGVEPPSRPANMREARALLETIEQTEDPTEESSETETDSSTGPSDVSDGSLLPRDENDSATS